MNNEYEITLISSDQKVVYTVTTQATLQEINGQINQQIDICRKENLFMTIPVLSEQQVHNIKATSIKGFSIRKVVAQPQGIVEVPDDGTDEEPMTRWHDIEWNLEEEDE